MVGIFAFSKKIHSWVCNWGFWKDWKGKTQCVRVRSWIDSSISITFSSMFITMTLAAYYFGCVSLIGFLTNLLTLWAISWIFYGIMLVCLVGFLWPQGAAAIAWVVSWLMRYVLLIAKTLSSFPLAAVYLKSTLIGGWLVICYLLIIAFLIWKNRKPFILIGSLVMSLMVAILLSWLLPLMSQSQVTILNVGQGQSIVLQSGGKTFLVDCGGEDPKEAADQAAETLLSMGIYRLDGIILTHYDQDHSGGIPYLLTRIKATNIYLPAFSEEDGSQQVILDAADHASVLVRQDTHLAWSDCSLEIFAPISQSDDNESGLSVLFCGRNCDILITGDMSISVENKLLLEKNIPQLTAFVAGHHGSPDSTGDGLLSTTNPQYVFVSVGLDNPYGHPSEEVLERLSRYGCIVYRTDRDGTIVFRR
jgi:competence protein ComEC